MEDCMASLARWQSIPRPSSCLATLTPSLTEKPAQHPTAVARERLDKMTGETGGEPIPKTEYPQIYVERTLAIIKPDAVHKCEEIEDVILRSGFTILQKRRVHLTPEQTSEFYAEHYGKLFFPSLVAYMSSGAVIALALAREKAISYWRELIGPTNAIKAQETHPDCLRAIYGSDEQRNGLHGSDSYSSAERELRFFFPDSVIEPVPVGQASKDYLARAINPTLLKGLTALCKQKPRDPVIWLADWLLENNPNKPKVKDPLVVEPSD